MKHATVTMTQDQYNNVLAALRYWQENGQCEPDNRDDDMQAIATADGDGQSLSEEEMDAMIASWQHGGAVVWTDAPERVTWHNPDAN